MSIGDQTGYQVDEKVKWTAKARMLNLRNILELVIDRFDD